MMFSTRLVDTTHKHIDQLVLGKVSEGLHIDFKRELPAAWNDKAKHRGGAANSNTATSGNSATTTRA
jgi:hypothetical protein